MSKFNELRQKVVDAEAEFIKAQDKLRDAEIALLKSIELNKIYTISNNNIDFYNVKIVGISLGETPYFVIEDAEGNRKYKDNIVEILKQKE